MKNKIIKNVLGYSLTLMSICAVIIQFRITGDLSTADLQHHYLFYINYACTILYLFFLLLDTLRGTLKWNWNSMHVSIVMTLLLTNFMLFNGNFLITSTITSWLHNFLIINALVLLAIPFVKHSPKYIRFAHLFLMGFALQIALYFTVFLFPTFIGLVATSFLLGFSVLGFVPILLLLFTFQFFQRNRQKHAYKILIVSFLVTSFIVTKYTVEWYTNDQDIATISIQELEEKLPINGVSEKIIMGEFVYDSFDQYWTHWGMKGSHLKKHNPLVSIALLVSNKTNFNHEERVSILNQYFKNYFGAHQRIWEATIFKTNIVLKEPNKPLHQQSLIIFIFPALFILTFYQINQYDF